MEITLSKIYTLNYKKVIVGYYTNKPLARHAIFQKSTVDPIINYSNPNIKFKWGFNLPDDVRSSPITGIHTFVPELIVNFVGGKVKLYR